MYVLLVLPCCCGITGSETTHTQRTYTQQYAPIYIDTDEVANIPYFWPTFIRKSTPARTLAAHSGFMASVFDDHIFHHDIYAAARFFKWLGQMIKVSITFLICIWPSAGTISVFILTVLPFEVSQEGVSEDSPDPNPVRPRWQRWIIYKWNRFSSKYGPVIMEAAVGAPAVVSVS